jgi:predicted ester cyclase
MNYYVQILKNFLYYVLEICIEKNIVTINLKKVSSGILSSSSCYEDHSSYRLFLAFSDFKITVLDQIAEGDKVITRAMITGIHTGEFKGRSASGNHVKVSVMS